MGFAPWCISIAWGLWLGNNIMTDLYIYTPFPLAQPLSKNPPAPLPYSPNIDKLLVFLFVFSPTLTYVMYTLCRIIYQWEEVYCRCLYPSESCFRVVVTKYFSFFDLRYYYTYSVFLRTGSVQSEMYISTRESLYVFKFYFVCIILTTRKLICIEYKNILFKCSLTLWDDMSKIY